MKRVFCALAGVSALALTASAATWTGRGDLARSFGDPANFSSGKLPAAGETLYFETGAPDLHVRDDDVALVNGLKTLYIDGNSRVYWDVTTNACLYANIAGSGGMFYKMGKDTTLTFAMPLSSAKDQFPIQGAYTVAEGRLRLPHYGEASYTGPAPTPSLFVFGNCTVSNGATLVVAEKAPTVSTTSEFYRLLNYGHVTNENASVTHTLNTRTASSTPANPSLSYGPIGGKLTLGGSGCFDIYNENCTYSSLNPICSTDGKQAHPTVIGFKSFGLNNGSPSSAGVQSNIRYTWSGVLFKYLGTGETTNKRFDFQLHDYYSRWKNNYIPGLDGGPHGGLVYNGAFYLGTSSPNHAHLQFTGSNAAPCVVGGSFYPWTQYGSTNISVFVYKRGTGTWRFTDGLAIWADGSKVSQYGGLTGGFAIEEGVLQTDSMSDRYQHSSLGTMTDLYGEYFGRHDETKRVDWAISFGTDDANGVPLTEGTLESLSTNLAYASERRMVLRGNGRLRSSGAGAFCMAHVSARTAGEKTLTLDGTNRLDNVLSEVSDGLGRVSVVKEGSGKWVLNANQTFSGDLVVKSGTLVVQAPTNRYSWFRFSDMSNGDSIAQLSEIAFYDASGQQQNVGLKLGGGFQTSNAYSQWVRNLCAELQPGECGPGRACHATLYSGGSAMTHLFDGTSADGCHHHGMSAPKPTNPVIWNTVALRLTNGAPAITSYDICRGSDAGRITKRFRIEGSRDGLLWATLDERDTPPGGVVSTWMSDGAGFVKGEKRPLSDSKGYVIADGTADTVSSLAHVRSVSVAPGATLKAADENVAPLASLSVDETGMGTIEGFALAPTGTLDIAAADEIINGTTIPFDFRNVCGVENLTNWTMTVNGVVDPKYVFRPSASGLVVECPNQPLILTAANAEVLVSSKASSATRFAVQELTNLLSRVWGSSVRVVTKPTADRRQIVVGVNEWSQAEGIDPEMTGKDDGFVIHTTTNRVYLCGTDGTVSYYEAVIARGQGTGMMQGRRSSSFAVYEFLERYADCRFYWPGELGTLAPQAERVRVPLGTLPCAPNFLIRKYYHVSSDGDWANNGWIENNEYTNGTGLMLNWSRLRMASFDIPCCHGVRFFEFLRRFGETHPEYFALKDDGTRFTKYAGYESSRDGYLCFSSGVMEEWYQDIKSYLTGEDASVRKIHLASGKWTWPTSGFRDHKYVDVMPNDSQYKCRCAACMAKYNEEDPTGNYMTELVWGYTRDFAQRLIDEGVPGYLTQMAYSEYSRVPDFDLPTNILVMVAKTGPFSIRKAEKLATDNAEIRKWKAKTGNVWIWTYPNKYSSLNIAGVPTMTPHAWGDYYKGIAPDVFGAFAESECDRFFFNHLNYYVFSKVCWDHSVDVDEILDEYYERCYGDAAEEAKAFCEALEDKFLDEMVGAYRMTDAGPVAKSVSEYEVWTHVYSPEVLASWAALLDQGAAKLAPGSDEARRFQLFRDELLGVMERRSTAYLTAIDPVAAAQAWAENPPKDNLITRDLPWSSGTVDTTEKIVTDSSIKVVSTTTSATALYYLDGRNGITLKPNTRYRLSFFFKGENITPLSTSAGGGAGATICDAYNHSFPKTAGLTGTFDWIYQSFEFTTESETNIRCLSYLYLRLTNATGTAWFDGISLVEMPEQCVTPGNCAVVIDPAAPKVTRFAADELARILSRRFGGAEVPVRTALEDGVFAFVVGDNDWSRAAGVDVSTLPSDGFVVKMVGDRVYLAGHDDPTADLAAWVEANGTESFEKGSVFAVYDFLEKQADCRFFFAHELGEIVPRADDLPLSAVDWTSSPVLAVRGVSEGVACRPMAGLTTASFARNRLKTRLASVPGVAEDQATNAAAWVCVEGPLSLKRPADLAADDARLTDVRTNLGRKVSVELAAGKTGRGALRGVPTFAQTAFGTYLADRLDLLNGVFADCTSDRWFFQHLNYYVLGKVAWGSPVSVARIKGDYCNKMFGPTVAQWYMNEMITSLTTNWTERICGVTPPTCQEVWEEIFSPKVLQGYDTQLTYARNNSLKYGDTNVTARIDLYRTEIYEPLKAASDRYFNGPQGLLLEIR